MTTTELTQGVTVTPEMVEAIRHHPLRETATTHARTLYPNHATTEADTACTWLYGAMCAMWGVVMTHPTGLDRLQQDAFWQGVEWVETQEDEQ